MFVTNAYRHPVANLTFDCVHSDTSMSLQLSSPHIQESTMKFAKHIITTAVAVCIGFAATAAFAQSTPVADQRQANQSARIANGEASGALSKREAARMKAGQAKVQGMEAAAKADGKVTRAERQAIQKEQNKQSRRIYRQKHDGNKK